VVVGPIFNLVLLFTIFFKIGLKVGFWVVILVDLLVIQHQPTTSLLV
jgi:hypothetical protein